MFNRGTLVHMPAPVAPAGAQAPPAQAGGRIPFLVGSNQYRETPFFTDVQLMDATSHEFVHPITPGGFLRGVTLQVTSTGGVLGTTATLIGDTPWSILSSISLEDISGGPILYPMDGFAYMVCQKYMRPWEGDPAKRTDFSNTINPAFTLRLFPEVKDTLAVLANTDARAQYRLRYTIAPLTRTNGQYGLVTVATGVTGPTLTIKGYINAWAQPDDHDLLGNQIGQVPDGLVASRFLMHELPQLVAGNNVIRATLVGNELRALALIIRDGSANKLRTNLTDATGGPVDHRLDNRRLWKMNQSQWFEEMQCFYGYLGNGAWTRDTGVYIVPRFSGAASPGDPQAGQGEYWLQTVEQTLMQFEMSGSDLATAPGTVEIIYDSLAVAGQVPAELEGI